MFRKSLKSHRVARADTAQKCNDRVKESSPERDGAISERPDRSPRARMSKGCERTRKGGLVHAGRGNRNRDAGAIHANIAVVCFRAEFSANVIFEHSSEVENGVRSTCLRANPPSSFPADSISLYVPTVPAV